MKEVTLRNVIAVCKLQPFPHMLVCQKKYPPPKVGCHAYLHASYTVFVMKLLFFFTFLSPQRGKTSASLSSCCSMKATGFTLPYPLR